MYTTQGYTGRHIGRDIPTRVCLRVQKERNIPTRVYLRV